jgi:AmmeMemoRadiSam system protein B
MSNIREPVVAGSFYSANPGSLSQQVRGFLSRAEPQEMKGEIKALVSPHAGYIYSGGVAAYGYKLLESSPYDLVVVISPSHRTYFSGLSIWDGDAYRTPLGLIEVAQEEVKALISFYDFISYRAEAHSQEHALEVQLPFLQETIKKFQLIPIIMGDQSYQLCQLASGALAKILQGKRALIVASSDLSHYHPYGVAQGLDQVVIDDINAFNPQKLGEDISQGRCEACGGGPMITAMLASQTLGADRAEVLHYANSGDVMGDRGAVVGYLSAVIYKS